MTAGEITELRLALGLSAPQLARFLHMHPRSVRRWEDGSGALPQGIALALLQALSVARRRVLDPRSLGHRLMLGVAPLVVAALGAEPVELLVQHLQAPEPMTANGKNNGGIH